MQRPHCLLLPLFPSLTLAPSLPTSFTHRMCCHRSRKENKGNGGTRNSSHSNTHSQLGATQGYSHPFSVTLLEEPPVCSGRPRGEAPRKTSNPREPTVCREGLPCPQGATSLRGRPPKDQRTRKGACSLSLTYTNI